MKTASDVRLKEWKPSALAMKDLLDMARMMYWESAFEDDSDGSYRRGLDQAQSAFSRIGLEVGPYDDFDKRLKEVLKMSPTELFDTLDKVKQTRRDLEPDGS
jgi:hypothetical protein